MWNRRHNLESDMAFKLAGLSGLIEKLRDNGEQSLLQRLLRRSATNTAHSVDSVKNTRLILFLGLFLLVAAVSLWLDVSQNQHDNAYIERVAQTQIGAQSLAKNVQLVARGLASAQPMAQSETSHISALIAGLQDEGGVFGYGEGITAALQGMTAEWQAVEKLLKQQQTADASPDSAANATAIASGADRIVSAGNALIQAAHHSSRAGLWLIIAVVAGVLAGITMVLFGRRQVKTAESHFASVEQVNLTNQEAVLKLLDEMGDLADGDLTVKAEVSENITGAIADSINYTIDSLRSLVEEINHATAQVSSASDQAQSITMRLQAAAQKQSQQIEEAGAAVKQIAESIREVSVNAGESAQVAQRSLQAASQGAVAVQNTIAGMNDIRSQIQETSKRIKRLGESSQEIGEIVELISDITEQTNILALNAAIQAASAGEAGRGFTVVAEEVQRLAERSSEATRQIGAIVKTIQQDTHDAVSAMERSTEGVVEGAKLSDAAGQALNEIGEVTSSLAQRIASISQTTGAQTEMERKVTQLMEEIQAITSQTTEGTKQTAGAIGQLADLAEELKASVAGFKLS